MTKDMTSGSPMKLILGFSVPLLFGFLFQQFYNLVDTLIATGRTRIALYGTNPTPCPMKAGRKPFITLSGRRTSGMFTSMTAPWSGASEAFREPWRTMMP